MSAPVFIEPVVNREQGDCALACLVMWTGKPYQDVIAAAPTNAHKDGMYGRDVVATAARLGTRLRPRRKFDLHADEGLLMLNPHPRKHPGQKWLRPSHCVILLGGMVLDPYNCRLWLDADVYLTTERYKLGQLMVEDE